MWTENNDQINLEWRSPRGVVVNVLDCDIKVREFEIRLRFYVNFRTLTLEKGCCFWLFGFYGISTFVGHLTPNSVYKYIYIQPKISERILRYVKFSISKISFVCTRLTSFKLSYFLVQLCLSQEGHNVILRKVQTSLSLSYE